jgi:RNA polymerase sigma-70 factor, ECF subfamily
MSKINVRNRHFPANRPAGKVSGLMEPVPTSDPSDGSLVREALAGDRDAFDELVRRHQAQAIAVSMRLLNNQADAIEIVQDSMLKAYRSLKGLQKPEAFAGWLMRIVSNLSLNRRRGRSLRKGTSLNDDEGGTFDADGAKQTTGESLASGSADPARAAQGKELGTALDAALNRLPDKQRLALVMFTIQQLPQKEVADALDCSVEAVKWHVFQGRKKLRELLKDHL